MSVILSKSSLKAIVITRRAPLYRRVLPFTSTLKEDDYVVRALKIEATIETLLNGPRFSWIEVPKSLRRHVGNDLGRDRLW